MEVFIFLPQDSSRILKVESDENVRLACRWSSKGTQRKKLSSSD